VADTEGLVGEVPELCDPGENFEDMLDSHEFRRWVPGDGDLGPPFNVAAFSVELLLENPGRPGMGLGAVGECSLASSTLVFWTEIDFSVDNL